METKTFYNEVLTDHNMHPYHKHDIDNADLELEGVNPSCGDDIILKLKLMMLRKLLLMGHLQEMAAQYRRHQQI